MSYFQARSSCPVCRAVFRRTLTCCPLDGAAVMPLPGDPLVGETIAGRYEVNRVDGDTRTRRIYRGRDAIDGQPVVVQVLFGELVSRVEHLERFARDAAIASGLSHPHIVAVLDFGVMPGGLPYVVTPYRETRSLEALLREEAPFTSRRARRIAVCLADALDHAHQRGVLHLNLKPTTVLVGPGSRSNEAVWLSGFHRAVRDGELFDPGDCHAVGTPAYVAPEVFAGEPDVRSDLFALGVVLYRMLCGELPFAGVPLHLAGDDVTALPIDARVPTLDIDEDLAAAALRLVSARPAHRFATARDVYRALGGL